MTPSSSAPAPDRKTRRALDVFPQLVAGDVTSWSTGNVRMKRDADGQIVLSDAAAKILARWLLRR